MIERQTEYFRKPETIAPSVVDDIEITTATKDVININPNDLLGKIADGIRNIVGLAVEIGHPSEATVPLIISNAFKNLAALSVESG